MKRLYIRVRVVPGVVPEATKVVRLDTGRDMAGRVPVRYAEPLILAAPGARVRATIFADETPQLAGHHGHAGRERRLRMVRVCFRVVR